MWGSYRSGDTIGWGTDYDWSGQKNSVKSFASVVLGWHWGWKSKDTGLPVKLAARKPVTSKWDFTVKQSKASTYDVAYDMWLHGTADTDWSSTPKHEVMVWLDRAGGAAPLGVKRARIQLAGAAWDLYVGKTGWNVYSFVRVKGTRSARLDLDAFLQALVKRRLIAGSDYLSSVEAGTEVFTGKAQLDTTAYSTTVG